MSLRRILLQTPPRELGFAQQAAYLLAASARLGEVDERLAGWRIDHGDRRGASLGSAAELAAELERRETSWERAGVRHRRQRVMVGVPEGRLLRAHLELGVGFDERGGARAATSATLSFAWLGRQPPAADGFRRMLTALVALYRPLWASLGGAIAPSPRFDEGGVPIVGWDTFLCKAYGELPRLPDAAGVTPLGDQGVIVRAFGSPLDEDDPRHLAALTQLARLLRGAGVLVPVARLRGVPHAPVEVEGKVVATPAGFAETADLSALIAGGGPALPFAAVAAARPIAAASEPATGSGETADLTDLIGRADAPLPFPSSKPAGPPAGVDWTKTMDLGAAMQASPRAAGDMAQQLDGYAALCAQLARQPQRKPAILAAFAIRDEAHLEELGAWWKARFAGDPRLYATWLERYREHSLKG